MTRLQTSREMSVSNIIDKINSSLRNVSRSLIRNNGKYEFQGQYFSPANMHFDVVTNGYNLHSTKNDYVEFHKQEIRDIITSDGIHFAEGKFGEFFNHDDARDYHSFVTHLDKFDPTLFQHDDNPDSLVIGTIYLSTQAPERRVQGRKEHDQKRFIQQLHTLDNQLIKNEEDAKDVFFKTQEVYPESMFKIDIMGTNTDDYEYQPIKTAKKMFSDQYSFGSMKVKVESGGVVKFIIYVKRSGRIVSFDKKNKMELFLDQNKKYWSDAEVDIYLNGKLELDNYLGFDDINSLERKYKIKFDKGSLYYRKDRIVRIRVEFTKEKGND